MSSSVKGSKLLHHNLLIIKELSSSVVSVVSSREVKGPDANLDGDQALVGTSYPIPPENLLHLLHPSCVAPNGLLIFLTLSHG